MAANPKVPHLGTTRMICMQLSVDCVRWPDDLLLKIGAEIDGRPATPSEIRDWLLDQRNLGLEVLPCDRHECDEKGRCTGRSLTSAVPS